MFSHYHWGQLRENSGLSTSLIVLHLLRWLTSLLAVIGLAACVTAEGNVAAPEAGAVSPVPDSAQVDYVPSSEPLRLGLQHFNRGNYGLAERYFRDVVEKDPNNAMAWIGLAGSYDHIGRFELADRAYATAIRLSGETPQILNNMGYSYILRGQYATARKYIMKARALAPGDPTIESNVVLIGTLAAPARP